MQDDQPATEPGDARRGPRHLAAAPRRARRPRPSLSTRWARSVAQAIHPRSHDDEELPPDPIFPLDDTSALERVRSGVVLAVLLAILGLAAAIAVGVIAVALVTTLKQAVG